jgi:DNA-directed RNA polymerase beta' subunit
MKARDLRDALGLHVELQHVALEWLDIETLRRRAPGVVHSLITYNRHTQKPEPGGVFDEAIFGEGASLEVRRARDDDTVTRERSTRFGRIVLAEPVPHPLAPGEAMLEVPVLPPDLRPIVRHQGELLISELNEHYRFVLKWNGRLGKLRELAAPVAIVEEARTELAKAVAGLVDNERQPEPVRNDADKPVCSLRGLLRPDPDRALAALDEAASAGADPAAPLPLSLHRTVAVLFAMGVVVTLRSARTDRT